MDIVDKINHAYSLLSKKEQALALYAIEKSDEMADKDIRKFAEETDISMSTISRFVRKIGFRNFEQFRSSFEASEERPSKYIGGNPSYVKKKSIGIYRIYQEVIREAQEMIGVDMIERAIEAIKGSGRVFVYGMGSSGLTATEFRQRLTRMGINAFVATDDHMMAIHNQSIRKGDSVIGISASGKTYEVVQSLKSAKAHGAKTIAITATEGPLSQAVHYPIVCGHELMIEDFINSQIPLVYAIDVICMLLLDDNRLRWNLERTILSMDAIKAK